MGRVVTGLSQLVLLALSAWLAARTLLILLDPQPGELDSNQRRAVQIAPDLLAQHWSARTLVSGDAIPATQLPVSWLGQLREQTLQRTVVVVAYRAQPRVLAVGESLEPGVVLQRIDDSGLIFDNNGRLERLAWPQQRPLVGLKRSRQDA